MLNKEELKKFVENNPSLVSRKESKRYPGLFVIKYTKRVFYDNLWHKNKLLLECRGLVVDAEYNTVVRPFTKVFNHGENGTDFPPETLCTIVRKVNGFMACVTKHPKFDDLIISTTGSLDSDFCELARKWLFHPTMKPSLEAMLEDYDTFIFEICDPSDPHIVFEQPGAYLIGGYNDDSRLSEKYLDALGHYYGIERPVVETGIPFSEVLKLVRTVTHEGFMVYDHNGNCLKLKSPHYLVTKFLARLGETKYRKVFESGNLRAQMKHFDEEHYPLFKYIADVKDEFFVKTEQERIEFIKNFLRK